MAIKDKEVTAAKQKAAIVTTPSQDGSVTEISQLRQQISQLQIQLENSSSNKGGVANDELKEKLISTTVSHRIVQVQLSW